MASARPELLWAHRGLGTDLWLRVAVPSRGALVLVSPEHDRVPVTVGRLERAGMHDVTVPLAAMLLGGPEVSGIWQLELHDEQTRAVAGRNRGALGLRRIRIQDDERAYAVRVVSREDEAVRLEIELREPWAEVLAVDSAGTELQVRSRITRIRGPATDVVWCCRGTDDRFRAPVHQVGSEVTFALPAAALSPARHQDRWDAYLLCTDGRLRLGWHRDDLGDRRRAVVLPTVATAGGAVEFTTRFYLNQYSNLSAEILLSDRRRVRQARDRSHRSAIDAPPKRQSIARTGDADAPDPTWLHRSVSRAFAVAMSLIAPRPNDAPSGLSSAENGPIHLLLANAHGVGGTIRTTFNLADALSTTHQVHLTSAYRLEERRYYDLRDGVEFRTLVDYLWLESLSPLHPLTWLRRFALRAPTVLVPEQDKRSHRFNLWTDIQLLRYIRSIKAGSIISTRPGLNVIVARFARPGVALIGQQHLPFEAQTEDLLHATLPRYRRLHAITALTGQDVSELRERLPGRATEVVRLANPLAGIDPPRSPLTHTRILAAGRYSHAKGMDLLLDAMTLVKQQHPDWELRVYGKAKPEQLDAARRTILDRGLRDQVRLMASSERLELEMSKASICVVSSRHEAFGMVIIEAMSCGLPVVSFDCPRGPREIITHEEDGLLVPAEDATALAAGIIRLIEDPGERTRMAQAALRTAQRYDPSSIAAEVVALLDDLPAKFT